MFLKNKIKSIIDLIETSEINEIEISSFWGAQKNRVSQNQNTKHSSPFVESTPPQSVQVTQQTEESLPKETEPVQEAPVLAEEIVSQNHHEITAPLVGTYYSSPKPDADDFVKVGDIISVGQVICIIEAMKIFNEIESEVSGKVLEIIPESGTPIEFGQPMLIVEKSK